MKQDKGKFSFARAKAIASGKVVFSIMDGNEVVFTSKNFMVAVQQADYLQKANPETDYKFTVTEVK